MTETKVSLDSNAGPNVYWRELYSEWRNDIGVKNHQWLDFWCLESTLSCFGSNLTLSITCKRDSTTRDTKDQMLSPSLQTEKNWLPWRCPCIHNVALNVLIGTHLCTAFQFELDITSSLEQNTNTIQQLAVQKIQNVTCWNQQNWLASHKWFARELIAAFFLVSWILFLLPEKWVWMHSLCCDDKMVWLHLCFCNSQTLVMSCRQKLAWQKQTLTEHLYFALDFGVCLLPSCQRKLEKSNLLDKERDQLMKCELQLGALLLLTIWCFLSWSVDCSVLSDATASSKMHCNTVQSISGQLTILMVWDKVAAHWQEHADVCVNCAMETIETVCNKFTWWWALVLTKLTHVNQFQLQFSWQCDIFCHKSRIQRFESIILDTCICHGESNQNHFAIREWCHMQHGLQSQDVFLMLLHCVAWWLVNCKVWLQAGNLGWMVTMSAGGANWSMPHWCECVCSWCQKTALQSPKPLAKCKTTKLDGSNQVLFAKKACHQPQPTLAHLQKLDTKRKQLRDRPHTLLMSQNAMDWFWQSFFEQSENMIELSSMEPIDLMQNGTCDSFCCTVFHLSSFVVKTNCRVGCCRQ